MLKTVGNKYSTPYKKSNITETTDLQYLVSEKRVMF